MGLKCLVYAKQLHFYREFFQYVFKKSSKMKLMSKWKYRENQPLDFFFMQNVIPKNAQN